MSKPKPINVSVLVDASQPEKLESVVKELRGKGFVLKESLEAIGVLTGSVPAASLQEIAEIPGVVSVEEDRTDYRTQ